MISSIRGTVLAIELDYAVVDVGGVGITVQTTPTTLATLRRGESAQLHTDLIVREDSLTLFGFADTESRELFRLLQTVSGIGPRLALAALAVLEPETLRTALGAGDTKVLTQVPGIGRKGAERLTLELRDKVGSVETSAAPTTEPTPDAAVHSDVVAALTGLGFSTKQSEQAVEQVLGDGVAGDTSGVLRAALTRLGSKR